MLFPSLSHPGLPPASPHLLASHPLAASCQMAAHSTFHSELLLQYMPSPSLPHSSWHVSPDYTAWINTWWSFCMSSPMVLAPLPSSYFHVKPSHSSSLTKSHPDSFDEQGVSHQLRPGKMSPSSWQDPLFPDPNLATLYSVFRKVVQHASPVQSDYLLLFLFHLQG